MNDSSNIFGGSWLFAFLIIALLFGGGNGLGWGNNGTSVETAVQNAINNQSTQNGIRDVLLSSANNNYETAQLVNSQTMALMQQNYANQINVVQGYNTLNSTLQGIGAGIQDSISRLGYQLDSCCCSIKTQMLQDKYDRLYEQYRSVQTDASNAAQSQYLLGVMGKWIANPAAVAVV
jgi:hypothetical protein